MTEPKRSSWSAEDQARIARQIMRRQAGLSLKIAAVFLVLLLGLPLVNRYAPAVAQYPVFGFPASWLFLGVLFYPITVALSVIFVGASDRIESECMSYFDSERAEVRR